MASSSPTSVLQYVYEPEGAKGDQCPYCFGKDCSIDNTMYAYKLSCADYQELMDRGWARCGQLCFKPIMDKTCCPQYGMKCEALNFKLSKSQKKVLMKLRKYLETGSVKDPAPPPAPPPLQGDDHKTLSSKKVSVKTRKCAQETHDAASTTNATSDDSSKLAEVQIRDTQHSMEEEDSSNVASQESEDAPPKSVPMCAQRGNKKKLQSMDVTTVLRNAQVKKTVEDFISLDAPMSGKKHRLEVKLVQSSPRTTEFNESFDESLALYQKYHMSVHKGKEEDCTEERFTRFLVDSSLVRAPSGGAGPEYGSYHQQYYLDGKLVMVGVIDILPRCLCSMYVYYDPAIMFLSPGVVSALYEVAYTRMLHSLIPSLEIYSMGYYVHSCQKMRYKGQYSPSFLLCPETYRWQPIEKCLPKLDRSKYARLEDEEGHTQEPVEDYLHQVLLWAGNEQPIQYGSLNVMWGRNELLFDDHVKEYATLVGKCVSTRAALILR